MYLVLVLSLIPAVFFCLLQMPFACSECQIDYVLGEAVKGHFIVTVNRLRSDLVIDCDSDIQKGCQVYTAMMIAYCPWPVDADMVELKDKQKYLSAHNARFRRTFSLYISAMCLHVYRQFLLDSTP